MEAKYFEVSALVFAVLVGAALCHLSIVRGTELLFSLDGTLQRELKNAGNPRITIILAIACLCLIGISKHWSLHSSNEMSFIAFMLFGLASVGILIWLATLALNFIKRLEWAIGITRDSQVMRGLITRVDEILRDNDQSSRGYCHITVCDTNGKEHTFCVNKDVLGNVSVFSKSVTVFYWRDQEKPHITFIAET